VKKNFNNSISSETILLAPNAEIKKLRQIWRQFQHTQTLDLRSGMLELALYDRIWCNIIEILTFLLWPTATGHFFWYCNPCRGLLF